MHPFIFKTSIFIFASLALGLDIHGPVDPTVDPIHPILESFRRESIPEFKQSACSVFRPSPPPHCPDCVKRSKCDIPEVSVDCNGTTDVVTSWYFDKVRRVCNSYLSGNGCRRGPFTSRSECESAVALGKCDY